MSVRTLTIAVFVALAGAAVVLYLLGRARRFGLVPLGEVVDAARSTVAVRLGLVVAWTWLGWHLLAR